MNQGLSLEEVSNEQVTPFISSTSPSNLVSENGSYHLIRLSEVFDRSSVFVAKAPGISKIQEFSIRLLDIIGTLSLLILAAPVTIIIYVLTKITSPGPVVYKQKRIGRGGKVFTLYKFRTMIPEAEEVWGFLPATEDDVRITKLGKCLRKTRLDELPQLVNVLKGDMSLVGPRPENLYRVSMHKALQGLRLAVRPGITGLAQIRSLYDVKPDHKIRYDYLYIRNRSLFLNLYILAKTIPVVLKKSGW